MEDLRAAGWQAGGRERDKGEGRRERKGDGGSKGQRARVGRDGTGRDRTGREGKRDGTGKRDRERKVRVADAGQEVRNLTERRARFKKCMGDDREPRARTARGPVSLTTLRF